MVERATSLNPAVLRWARERAGLSIDDIAASLKKPPHVILDWEAGNAAPTYAQLETLAARLYKRPVAIFFFPEPPDERDLSAEFRSLPDSELERLEPPTRYAVREARAFQESLRELMALPSVDARHVLRDIDTSPDTDLGALAVEVRDYLRISLSRQTGWRDAGLAFKEWRGALENAGLFIFKGAIKQRTVSGFCLHDPDVPIIYVNNSTASTRQVFTLFHELAHLLFATSGITTLDAAYIDRLTGTSRQIEVACNEFASTFLVPPQNLDVRLVHFVPSADSISDLADYYKVSREVIARCLLDRNRLSRARYRELTDAWNEDYENREQRASGGNYYATKAAYLGDRFLHLEFSSYRNGRVSLPELAQHLDMKAKNVGRLEDFLIGRA